MVRVPKIVGELEFDEGSLQNGDVVCSICRKVVKATEDAYTGEGPKGGSHVLHPDCVIKVGLKW